MLYEIRAEINATLRFLVESDTEERAVQTVKKKYVPYAAMGDLTKQAIDIKTEKGDYFYACHVMDNDDIECEDEYESFDQFIEEHGETTKKWARSKKLIK